MKTARREFGPLRKRRIPAGSSSPEFLDPSREWRRLFAEAWGTFWLVAVAVGASIVAAVSDGKIPPWNVVAAPGLIVMIVIYFMGTVSGAHLNPVVTLAFAVRRNFPWWRVPGYLICTDCRRRHGSVVIAWNVWGEWSARRNRPRSACKCRASIGDGGAAFGRLDQYHSGCGIGGA